MVVRDDDESGTFKVGMMNKIELSCGTPGFNAAVGSRRPRCPCLLGAESLPVPQRPCLVLSKGSSHTLDAVLPPVQTDRLTHSIRQATPRSPMCPWKTVNARGKKTRNSRIWGDSPKFAVVAMHWHRVRPVHESVGSPAWIGCE